MTQDKTDKKEWTIEFAPGSFDNFEGTQEELDEMIADITRMAQDGSLFEQSEAISLEDLFEEDPEAALRFADELGLFEDLLDENGEQLTLEDIRNVMLGERNRRLN